MDGHPIGPALVVGLQTDRRTDSYLALTLTHYHCHYHYWTRLRLCPVGPDLVVGLRAILALQCPFPSLCAVDKCIMVSMYLP